MARLQSLRSRVGRARVRFLYRGDRLRNRLFRPVTLGARVLLVRDAEVLLVWHSYRRGWFLPGGGVAHGESFEAAARREAAEEAGATVRSLRLHGLYLNRVEDKVDHVAVFASTDFDIEPARSHEIDHARWFPLTALPESTARGTADRIAEYCAGAGPYSGDW